MWHWDSIWFQNISCGFAFPLFLFIQISVKRKKTILMVCIINNTMRIIIRDIFRNLIELFAA